MKATILLPLALLLLVLGCTAYQQAGQVTQQVDEQVQQQTIEEQQEQQQQADEQQAQEQQVEEQQELSGELVDGVREVSVTAKRYEFIPNPIVVRKEETVRLKITSTDVAHGIAIPAYGINVDLPPGKEVVVEFTADKAGEFDFYCSVYCGPGHGSMRGKLVVVE